MQTGKPDIERKRAEVIDAASVSAEDLEHLDRLGREHIEWFRVIDELWHWFREVPPDEVDREADRAVAELRAEVAVIVSKSSSRAGALS